MVFGTATSQNATAVLQAAIGGPAANLAKFLGHSKDGERGKFGLSHELPAGSVVILDEASLASLPDLKDVADHAAARDWKIIVIGDSEQLAAVERGGGLRLLAARLGYAELPHALRFRETWEQEASIRLRAGDATVLGGIRRPRPGHRRAAGRGARAGAAVVRGGGARRPGPLADGRVPGNVP